MGLAADVYACVVSLMLVVLCSVDVRAMLSIVFLRNVLINVLLLVAMTDAVFVVAMCMHLMGVAAIVLASRVTSVLITRMCSYGYESNHSFSSS